MAIFLLLAALVGGAVFVTVRQWDTVIALQWKKLVAGTVDERQAIMKGSRAVWQGGARRVCNSIGWILLVGVFMVLGPMLSGDAPGLASLACMLCGLVGWVRCIRHSPDAPEVPNRRPFLATVKDEGSLARWWRGAKNIYSWVLNVHYWVLRWLRNLPEAQQSPMMVCVQGLFTFGLVTFTISQWIGNRPLAIVGALFILSAAYLAFSLAWAICRALVAGLDLAEFSGEQIIELGRELHHAFERLSAKAAAKRVNIADQEEIMPMLKIAWLGLLSSISTTLIFGIHFPGKVTMEICAILGLTTLLAWKAMQSAGINILRYQVATAKLQYLVCQLLLVYTIIRLVRPQWLIGIESWVAYRATDGFQFLHLPASIGGLVIGLLGLWLSQVWQAKPVDLELTDKTKVPDVSFASWCRVGAAAAFGLLALFSGTSLAVAGISHGKSDPLSVVHGLSLSKMQVPRVEVVTDAESKPVVKLAWDEIPNARSYIIRQRKSNEIAFSLVADLGADVTHWEQRDVERGVTYYYQLLARYEGRFSPKLSYFSVEVEVKIPPRYALSVVPSGSAAAALPSASSQPKAKPPAPPAVPTSASSVPSVVPDTGKAPEEGCDGMLPEFCKLFKTATADAGK